MRNPARTAITSAALMVGLGLVVFVAVFAAGMKATVSGSFDRLLTGDLVVTGESMQPVPRRTGEAHRRRARARAPSTPQFVDQIQVNGEPSERGDRHRQRRRAGPAARRLGRSNGAETAPMRCSSG